MQERPRNVVPLSAQREMNEFLQIHPPFCHYSQVEDMGFEPRQSGSRDLLLTSTFYHLTVNSDSKSEKNVESCTGFFFSVFFPHVTVPGGLNAVPGNFVEVTDFRKE